MMLPKSAIQDSSNAGGGGKRVTRLKKVNKVEGRTDLVVSSDFFHKDWTVKGGFDVVVGPVGVEVVVTQVGAFAEEEGDFDVAAGLWRWACQFEQFGHSALRR